MATSFIKMTAIGNVGKELKLNTLPSGSTVVNFSIASTNRWTDKLTGEPKEHTDWLDVVAYGKTAELIHQFVQPGGRIYLTGDFETGSFVNQDQQRVKTVRLVVSDFTALDKPDAANTRANFNQGQGYAQNNGFDSYQEQPQSGGFNQQPAGGFQQQAPSRAAQPQRQQRPQQGNQRPQGRY
jgi:single-strand DNA-binding protein